MVDIKQKILIEMNYIVHKLSFSSVTFGKIAEKLFITRESIHHHYKTKEILGVEYIKFLHRLLEEFFHDLHTSELSGKQKLLKYYQLYRLENNPYVSCPLVSLINEYQELYPSMQKEILKLIDIEFKNVKMIINLTDTHTDAEVKFYIMLLKGATLYEKTNQPYFDDVINLIKL